MSSDTSCPGPSRNAHVHAECTSASRSHPTMSTVYEAPEAVLDLLDVSPGRGGRTLCVRHKQKANQNINEKLQKVRQSSAH